MAQQEPQVVTGPVSADLLDTIEGGQGYGLAVARVVDEAIGYALFVLAGDLDEVSAPRLLEHLLAAAQRPAVDLVILDLHQLGFLGAPGARCLEAAWRACEREGARLVACRPTDFVRQVLETAGLHDILDHDGEF